MPARKKKTPPSRTLIPAERIEQAIFLVRGHRVMLDADLADLYGVQTRHLNQAVKRNGRRFPEDFMFQLTKQEKIQVITNCDHLSSLKFSPSLPYAFTEHGALMAANVLNSDQAIEMSVLIVRTFARLRQLTVAFKDLAKKVDEMERDYDERFIVVFDAIRQLMDPPEPEPKGRIGFKSDRNRPAP